MSNVRCVKCHQLKFTRDVHWISRGLVEGGGGIKRNDAECTACFVKPGKPETHWQETDNDPD